MHTVGQSPHITCRGQHEPHTHEKGANIEAIIEKAPPVKGGSGNTHPADKGGYPKRLFMPSDGCDDQQGGEKPQHQSHCDMQLEKEVTVDKCPENPLKQADKVVDRVRAWMGSRKYYPQIGHHAEQQLETQQD